MLGQPTYCIPFLWALSEEVANSVPVILSSDGFQYLRDSFADRRHPMASRFFYAITPAEDANVQAMVSSAAEKFASVQLECNIFDEFVLSCGMNIQEKVKACILQEAASRATDVKFTADDKYLPIGRFLLGHGLADLVEPLPE
eukprot:8772102-Karenia_brevis.AAC.1